MSNGTFIAIALIVAIVAMWYGVTSPAHTLTIQLIHLCVAKANNYEYLDSHTKLKHLIESAPLPPSKEPDLQSCHAVLRL